MSTVRIGIIGMGIAGTEYANKLLSKKIVNAELKAVAETDEVKIQQLRDGILPCNVKCYVNAYDMMKSGDLDAVIISCPSILHAQYAISAFENNLHVLLETPYATNITDAKLINNASTKFNKKFCVMLQERFKPEYKKMRKLIHSNFIYQVKTINITYTLSAYTTDYLYKMTPWRKSWKESGGGITIESLIHILDLLHWILNDSPYKVTSMVKESKERKTETDCEINALLEYESGVTVSISSNNFTCGTDRIEIQGYLGRLVVCDGNIKSYRFDMDEAIFNHINRSAFRKMEQDRSCIQIGKAVCGKSAILNDFCNSIQTDEPLLVDGKEAIRSLLTANAILLSSWINDSVYMPFDEGVYLQKLNERIKYYE